MASTSPVVLSMASSDALRAGVLFERGAARTAFDAVGEVDVDHVAGLDERVAVALPGPLPVFRQQDDLVCCRRAHESRAASALVTRACT